MYHNCSSFIIPGNLTANYLVVITNSSRSQKTLAEIHKWKCSLISFANGTVAAHMPYQQALFWVGIQCPGPSQQKLLSCALLSGNGKCHCPHCLIRTSYFAFCFLQPTCYYLCQQKNCLNTWALSFSYRPSMESSASTHRSSIERARCLKCSKVPNSLYAFSF
jgi:hypothetical protein